MLYTTIREDEKLLLAAARRRGDDLMLVRDADLVLNLQEDGLAADVVLNRSLSHSRALYASRFLERHGRPTVNRSEVIATCGDKALTSAALVSAGLATPRTLVAFTPESALKAIETVGYPAVLKPVVGSWGRLLARVSDREQAEQLLEHKASLGHYMHQIFYVQEYVGKPGYDIRSHVVGDRVTSAIRRSSDSWITNAARGAVCAPQAVTAEIEELSLRAAAAVGGGVLGVDLMPDPEGRLLVHEVNHRMEFKAAVAATGFDLPSAILEYVEEVSRG